MINQTLLTKFPQIFTVLLYLWCFGIAAQSLEENTSPISETESLPATTNTIDETDESIEKFTIKGTITQAELDWIESLHASVSNTVFRSAYWFDGFFTDDDTEQSRPYANARIRLGWEPKARDWEEFKTKFRVRLKLPHFKDRLDVILSDDQEDTLNNLPLETVNTRPQINDESFAAAVRFVHHSSADELTDSRIGISSGDIFLRARYKRRFSWKKTHGFRFQPALYYYVKDGVGARLLFEYDYQMSEKRQLRVNYSIRGSESFSGIRWKHGIYHLNQFSLFDAGALGLVVEGERNGENGFLIDKYTLSYRYRFNAYKKWLFFEVEPFLEWPEQHHYSTTPGIALRVEGYFYQND